MIEVKKWTYSLLKRSEGVFKTDMIYLARGGFWLSLGQFLAAISSLILATGFAHFIEKDTYGTYKYILSFGSILMAFSLTGLSTAVTNAAARNQDGTLKYAFKKNLEWSSITFALFTIVAAYYFIRGNHILAIGLIIIGAISPLLNSASLADSYLIGKKDFKSSTLTSNFALLVTNLLTLFAAVASGHVLVLIFTFMASSLILKLGTYIYSIKKHEPNSEVDETALNYGTHLSIIGILNVAVDRLDSIITFHFLGAAQLAIYSFAIAIPEQIKGLAKNVSALALPKFSANDMQHTYKTMLRKMLILTLALAALATIYICLSAIIFDIFFPQYKESALYLSRVYVLTLLPSAAVLPVTFLQALAAKRELYLFNVLSGVFQIIVMFLGLLSWGLLGLIISIGLSRLFRLLLSLLLTWNLQRERSIFS